MELDEARMWYLDQGGVEMADQVIKTVLESVDEKIDSLIISSKVMPYGVNSIVLLMFSAVEVRFVRREVGDFDLWIEEEEPRPTESDSWVRNVIPVKRKLVLSQSPPAAVNTKTDWSAFKRKLSLRVQPKVKTVIQEVKCDPIEEEEQVYDPHEEFLRLKKEREEKQKADGKIRLKALRLEEKKKKQLIMQKFRDQIPNFTHGTDGKLIFISPIKQFTKKQFETVDFKIAEEPNIKPEPRLTIEEPEKQISKKPPLLPPASDLYFVNIMDHIQLSPRVTIRKTQDFDQPKPEILHTKSEQLLLLPEIKLKVPSNYSKKLAIPESLTERPMQLKKKWKKTEIVNNVVKGMRDIDFHENLSPVDRFNLNIFGNNTWGANPSLREVKLPARLPKDNTMMDDWEVFGHIYRKPKDVLFALPSELMMGKDRVKKPKDRKVTKFASKPGYKFKVQGYFSP